MAHYQRVDAAPPKRHTQHRDASGALYDEELIGEEGFSADSSLLSHRHLKLHDLVDRSGQTWRDLVGPLVEVERLGALEDLLGPDEPAAAVAVVDTGSASAVAGLEIVRGIAPFRVAALEVSRATVYELVIAPAL